MNHAKCLKNRRLARAALGTRGALAALVMKLRNSLWVGAIALLACACGSAPDGPVGTSNQDLVVCAKGAVVQGVDVSYYQGSIDWTAVHNSGRAFGIARIADGTTFMDPTFGANYSGMKSVGMVRGELHLLPPRVRIRSRKATSSSRPSGISASAISRRCSTSR